MSYTLLAERLARAERRRTRAPRLCAFLWSCACYALALGIIVAMHLWVWTLFIWR